MKCLHQVALNQGSFKVGWALTGLHDPCKKKQHAGMAVEMEVVNEYLKTQEELVRRLGASAEKNTEAQK